MGAVSGEHSNGLKKYLVMGAIAGLLIGCAGAMVIFNYVIRAPLQQENARLNTDNARIELERRNHAQLVSGYDQAIETLRSELAAAAAAETGNAAAVQELELELKKTRDQLQDTQTSLKRARRRSQNPADGWSGKYR